MKVSTPLVKHLVLVGGGHSHLAVLRRLGMKPVPGLQVTLITRDVVTPYSGSLPAYLAGTYTYEQMHIDLSPLAQFAGARLIQQAIDHIDITGQTIHLKDRPPVHFDVLSLNTGSEPDSSLIEGADQHAIGIKPIDTLLEHWQVIREEAISAAQSKQAYQLAIVGGGPASIEFLLAVQAAINTELGLPVNSASALKLSLICAQETILSDHNSNVQQFAAGELKTRGIEVLLNKSVSRITERNLVCSDGSTIAADRIFYATGASLPSWLKELGLQLSEDNFIAVNKHLQSISHDYVFVAGDAATIANEPRPKSGVYAVRHGKILAHNLIAFARGKRLQRYRPQRQALALLSLSNGKAIASRGRLFFQGRLAWRLKHRIDTAFLRKYSDLPEMESDLQLSSGLVDRETERQLRKHALRCAGCGAKVPDAILKEVLGSLQIGAKNERDNSLASAEDAAIVELGKGLRLVQSVDFLNAFSNDHWLFARIASNHSLSDLHAMGITASSAQAIVGLPAASSQLFRAQLQDIMQACKLELDAEGCELVGGHSAETTTLQFGLCVNAVVSEVEPLLTKTGMQRGDVLILCKALGTGTLLAAQMRYKARYEWLQACHASMLQSNREAAQLFVANTATACTDITGFGLAGHLLEMLDKQVQIALDVGSIPHLPGAVDCLRLGFSSSLHADNSLAAEKMAMGEFQLGDPRVDILFDPQTAGGLLASVPSDKAEACVTALRAAGYSESAIVGEVLSDKAEHPLIVLR